MCLFSRLFIIIIIIIIIIAAAVLLLLVLLITFVLLRSVKFISIMNLRKWTVEESRRQTFCDTLDNNYA